MSDYRIGARVELHPGTDAWMSGDRFGTVVSVSRRARAFVDPRDPRNGRVFRVRMDRSGKVRRVAEGNILTLTTE